VVARCGPVAHPCQFFSEVGKLKTSHLSLPVFFRSWKIEDEEKGNKLEELNGKGLVEPIVLDGASIVRIWPNSGEFRSRRELKFPNFQSWPVYRRSSVLPQKLCIHRSMDWILGALKSFMGRSGIRVLLGADFLIETLKLAI
jgi:hypothetical protein